MSWRLIWSCALPSPICSWDRLRHPPHDKERERGCYNDISWSPNCFAASSLLHDSLVSLSVKVSFKLPLALLIMGRNWLMMVDESIKYPNLNCMMHTLRACQDCHWYSTKRRWVKSMVHRTEKNESCFMSDVQLEARHVFISSNW